MKLKSYLLWLAWISTLAARLWLFPVEMDLNAKGLAIWLHILFLLVLFGYVLLTALGMGRMIVHRFEEAFSLLESNLLALMLGLAVLAIAILASGLIGWLNSLIIFGILALAGIVSTQEWSAIGSLIRQKITGFRFSPAKNLYEMLLGIMLVIFLPLLLLNALSPVWDYDALVYHLEIPRQFLAQGRIYFDPEVFRSAYPFLGEMLFLIGLVFKVDAFAKLINLTYSILLVLSVYAFGKRFLGRETALIAAGILIGTPSIPFWATWVSIDFAWAGYEFWSLYIIILWLANAKKDSYRWLALAGILSGLAASTKYLSLATMVIVSAIILWQSLGSLNRLTTTTLKNLLVFGISAGLVMSPWYLKNWIWTGNPIYPLIWGGPGWDPLTTQVFNDYLRSFGIGTNWLDYLLIPYNVYANHNQFSTIYLEIIHPALWLAFAYPFLKQPKKNVVLFLYSAVYCVIWAINSQVIRFLLPPFAILALLAGDVIQKLPPLIKKIITNGLLGGLLLVSLIYQASLFQSYSAYFIGQKSAADMLKESVNDFQITQRIQELLRPDERAQFLWDGRGYYCDARCIPDDEQSTAVSLAVNSPPPQTLALDLRAKGITHLMLSKADVIWFIAYHDPHHYHQKALDYFENVFIPACGKLLYTNNQMELYQITCQ